MKTIVKHLHKTGQYQCTTCGSKNASIAGKALTFTHFLMYNGEQFSVGLTYVGDCERCNKKINIWQLIINQVLHGIGAK